MQCRNELTFACVRWIQQYTTLLVQTSVGLWLLGDSVLISVPGAKLIRKGRLNSHLTERHTCMWQSQKYASPLLTPNLTPSRTSQKEDLTEIVNWLFWGSFNSENHESCFELLSPTVYSILTLRSFFCWIIFIKSWNINVTWNWRFCLLSKALS